VKLREYLPSRPDCRVKVVLEHHTPVEVRELAWMVWQIAGDQRFFAA
jgi:hypothetical protein